MFRTCYGEELFVPCPLPKLEYHPLLGCPQLLIQHNRSPPYLESVSSIRILIVRHALITKNPFNVECSLVSNDTVLP